ncbi:uncharacterized protein [Prorops nasuta]|uniref:uncharacterized protein n=1 Tax=Prorops nasuta TaxID=863751 RepID=UPI0034CFFBA8
MAPTATKKLIIQQRDRANNIRRILPSFKSLERNRLSASIIKDRIKKLQNYWSEFCRWHEEIITRDDAVEDPYITESLFAETEAARDSCNDELMQALNNFPASNDTLTSTRISTDSDNSQILCSNIHLPKIDLPHFTGRYENWEAFENRFVSMIHDKTHLPNVVKLQYLMGCLQGPAADFVKDVTVTDANYISTWTALKERFSNLRLQIYHLTLSLINAAPLKRESALGLRTLVDDITHRIRMLKNLGRPVEFWDDLLVVIISERLDPVTRKAWETYLSTRGMHMSNDSLISSRKIPPTFKELIDFLEGTIQALFSVEAEHTIEKPSAQGKNPNPEKKNNKNSVKFHHAGIKSKSKGWNVGNDGTQILKCQICNSEHYLGKCDKFKALKGHERHDQIRQLGLCFNCLGRHQVRNCMSKRHCRKCQGNHHTLLHRDNSQNRNEANATIAVAVSDQTIEKSN